MARDGSGTYTLPAASTVAYKESPISSAKYNAVLTDFEDEITDSLSRSGKGAMLAALDAGSFKITNVALATTTGDALSYGRNATVANFAATGTFAAKLADGKIWVGNGSGDATAVTMSGDVTITNAGVAAIGAGVIVDNDISASAAITSTKIALADAKMLVGNGSGQAAAVTPSGAVTMSNAGVFTIASGNSINGTLAAKQFGTTEYDAGNSGTSKTIDLSNGQNQKLTLTGNCNGITLTNPVAGQTTKLKILSGAGSFSCVFTTTVKWPNGVAYSPTQTASATDIVTLYYDGSAWWGQASNGFA